MRGIEESHSADSEPIAPVLLFVFNRPNHTARVLEVIRRARPAQMLVVADGPRVDRPHEIELCARTRELVLKAIDWPCEIKSTFAVTNMGCKSRIASGLEWGFGQFDELIILEDDCVPTQSFFRYCTELLSRFRHDDRIGMIAGTNYRGVPDRGSRNTYFGSRHANIWGWASWRRAYCGYDPDLTAWRRDYRAQDLRAWFRGWRNVLLHSTMFDLVREKGIDTWDVGWGFHLAQRHMLSLVPEVNLITNIGVTGSNGREDDPNNLMPSAEMHFPLSHPEHVLPDDHYDHFVASRHRLVLDWLRAKWTNRAKKWLRNNV